MSIKVHVEITPAADGFNELESQLLALLAGNPAAAAATTVREPAAPATPAKTTPAKEPAKPATPKTTPAKPTPKVEPVKEPAPAEEEAAEEAEEDVMGTGGAETTYTLEEAVAAATELIGQGKLPVVKAALKPTAAAKVSELKGDDIQSFMAAIAV